jgi:acyl-CoA synthetase (NDP forming)
MIKSCMERMLNPQSIAVIGASEKKNYGGRLMNNLLVQGYSGQIYPVNPTSSHLFGLPCYSQLSEIDAVVDLAVIIVRAAWIEDILRQCEASKVGSVLIISAGFREQRTAEGILKETMVAEWSARTGIPVCGPNCLGMYSSSMNMWACSATTVGDQKLPSGSIGLISHSGGTAFGPLLNRGKDYGVGYRYIVNTGNEAGLSMADYADFMLDDPQVKAIGLFIEGIRDGEAFICLADKAFRLRKPMIALKIGESEVGRNAAASHTASMTGDQQVFEALCRQKHIILAKDYDEFLAFAGCCEYGKLLTGNRLAVISHSGGIGGFVGDRLGARELQLPQLQAGTAEQIDLLLTGFGSSGNPLDVSGTMQTERLVDIHRILESEEQLDGYVFATFGERALLERLSYIDRSTDKPLYLLWVGSQESVVLDEVRKLPIPLFFLPDTLAVTLERWHLYSMESVRSIEVNAAMPAGNAIPTKSPYNLEKDDFLTERIDTGIQAIPQVLTELEGKQWLQSIGIAVPVHHFLPQGGNFSDFISKIDFAGRSYAAKLVSRTVMHKSDAGGVALNLQQANQVQEFHDRKILHNDIAGQIEGMLLEEMVGDKVELILGSTTDPQFGPIIMLGLGGVLTELFQLVTWRVAPIDRTEALRMLGDIKGLRGILQGYRNSPEMDSEQLAKTIEIFSQWVYGQRARIESVEINPLAVLPLGRGVKALDCVISLKAGAL